MFFHRVYWQFDKICQSRATPSAGRGRPRTALSKTSTFQARIKRGLGQESRGPKLALVNGTPP